MNSGPTAERVYGALKAQILANGFAPGTRLDPALLANELASSVTPVREALHVLTGERLVDTRPADGFHVPNITVPDLEDRYAASAEILLLSLRRRRALPVRIGSRADSRDSASANRVAAIFAAIAARSVNNEHLRLTCAIGDRLHAARSVEPQVFDGVAEELAQIEAVADDPTSLRRVIMAYHRRRIRQASAIVRALHRHDGPNNRDINAV